MGIRTWVSQIIVRHSHHYATLAVKPSADKLPSVNRYAVVSSLGEGQDMHVINMWLQVLFLKKKYLQYIFLIPKYALWRRCRGFFSLRCTILPS